MASAFFLIYAFAGTEIASLLTDAAPIREGVREMRWWITALPPITVLAFLMDGVYVGLTQTGKMFLATLTGALLFFAVSCGAGHLPDENQRLWLGFEGYLLIRGGFLSVNYIRESRGKSGNFSNFAKEEKPKEKKQR